MKKYLIMSLAMAACSVMVSGCATDGSAGEDTDGSIQEAPASAHVIPEGTAEPVIQESIVQEPFSETEDIGNSDTDSADVTDSADTAYNGILDMFYYKIMGGWDHTEDVSYMFYWDYTSVKDLSDAGYALTDLDGNGVPELLVSTMEAAEKGLIYDLYTFADGVAVHAATSGERYCYYLCADNTVYYWASSGASNSTQIHYSIDPDTGSLHPDEIVAFDQMQDRDNPWFHSTQEDHYDRAEGLDFDRMSHITEAEAQDICAGYQAVAIELTPFDQYTPQEGMPDEIRLKQAFRSAAGSENELYFVCDDFDGNGSMEAFGITGTDDGIDLSDAIIYYAGSDGTVSVIDTFPKIYAYGGMYPGMTRKLTINAGTAEFLMIGGADGQETWLYGVKDGKAYQPEVSGQHADFRKTEDGRFVAQPHEGGEGYYSIVYDYDPASGEFIVAEGKVNLLPRQQERGSRHSGEGLPAIKKRMRTLNSEYEEKHKIRQAIPRKDGLPDMPEQEGIGRLIRQADEGNVQAQCELGNIFYNGEGVRRNSCEALRWFRKAAEQGYDKAQNILGALYANGYEKRIPDYAGALERYRTSECRRYRGVEVQFYYGSYNIKQDYAEALKWFRKAAGQGCENAQNNLGILYANGYGVEQDYAEALKWFRKAVEQGNSKAKSNLGDLYRYGHGVEQDYAEALKWYRKAAGQGVAAAWKSLGNMYCRGEGVEKDFVTAAEWYRKYVEVMYPIRQGVEKDSWEDIQNEYNAVIQDCVIQVVNNFDRPVVIAKTQQLESWDQHKVALAVSSTTMKVPFIMFGNNARGEYLGGIGVGEDDDMDFIMRTEVTHRIRKGARHCYMVTIRSGDYDKFVSSVTRNYIQLCKEKNKNPFTEYGAEFIKTR